MDTSPDGEPDRPQGSLWPASGGRPLATGRADLLAVLLGASAAVAIAALVPVNALVAAVFAGPIAGGLNRVYEAELATGFLAGTLGTLALAAFGVFTALLSMGTPAAAGTALVAPFVGMVTGALAIPFGRARQRFGAGHRAG